MAEITVVGAGGEYMESVVVVEWHKKVGDGVKAGELVVTVETAKAATEIEATSDGILAEIRADVGDEIAIGSVLGVIGESISEVPSSKPPQTGTSAEQPTVSSFKPPSHKADGGRRIIASPLARRVASQLNIDISKVEPSFGSSRVKVRDVEAYAAALGQKPDEHRGAIPGPARSAVEESRLQPPGVQTRQSTKLNIHSRGAPRGEKVVFLHGFGGDSLSWLPLLAAMSGEFNSILVDLPAHGRSPRPQGGISVHQMAEAVSDALDDAGIDDFHIVGHSLGGAVGLALMARGRLALRSLTLLAPAGLGPEIDGGFISGFARATRAESLSPWLMKLFADPSLASPAFVAATMQARSDIGLREAQVLIGEAVFPDGTQAADFRDVLKGSLIPQKIIWGEQDRIIPVQHAFRIGGQAALHLLPGVGHMPQIEAPAIVARLLAQNIRSAH